MTPSARDVTSALMLTAAIVTAEILSGSLFYQCFFNLIVPGKLVIFSEITLELVSNTPHN